MEITGKIIAVLPLQAGTGKNGTEWKKQDYVVETHDQYPKKMCFGIWGDRINEYNVQLGEEVVVSFDIDCREWNGKWFNDIRAWKIERGEQPKETAQPQQQPPASQPIKPKDDLPF